MGLISCLSRIVNRLNCIYKFFEPCRMGGEEMGYFSVKYWIANMLLSAAVSSARELKQNLWFAQARSKSITPYYLNLQ